MPKRWAPRLGNVKTVPKFYIRVHIHPVQKHYNWNILVELRLFSLIWFVLAAHFVPNVRGRNVPVDKIELLGVGNHVLQGVRRKRSVFHYEIKMGVGRWRWVTKSAKQVWEWFQNWKEEKFIKFIISLLALFQEKCSVLASDCCGPLDPMVDRLWTWKEK